MGELRADLRRFVERVPAWITAPGRVAERMRQDWQTVRRLAVKAGSRLGSARGFRSKLQELHWIAGKARDRVANRLKRTIAAASAPQTRLDRAAALTSQRTALSAVLAGASTLPACVPLGGGAIAIAIAAHRGKPSVLFRDGYSNLHPATIIDSYSMRFPAEEAPVTCFIIETPSEIFETGLTPISVLVRTAGEQVIFEDVATEPDHSIIVRGFQFENGCATFWGKHLGGATDFISLGLFVDGDLSASCTVSPNGNRFSGAVAPDHVHFDGRVHLLELRALPQMSLLASLDQILPLHLTPWKALQAHARPPLDGTLAPQGRHYFRSYQHWFHKLRQHGPDGVPPLDQLFVELSQGSKKRGTYPKIEFSTFAHPTVSIVMPVHNTCEVTYLCLCSLLFAFNETSFEIIVVDDGSSDETTNLPDFVHGIGILRNDRAEGFVRACNNGAARARGEFVLLLNNDTQVTARWLDELVAAFRNFDNVGLVGPKLVQTDGRLHAAGGVVLASGNPWNVGRDENPDDPRYGYLRKVDYVSGIALMIPRELWQRVGGFSNEFSPTSFEDADLAMKVRQTGHFVVYVPTSTIYHSEGQLAGFGVVAGPKSFREVNRPKFRKKWAHVFGTLGPEGKSLDRERDRDVAFRVLFIDHQFPFADIDAGSYAAFQEVRLLQAMGAKVTFLPRNLAWMDRHTFALQRAGVECLYAPYVTNFLEYIRTHACDYDLVLVTRYKIAEQVVPIVRSSSARTRVAFNLADLHFLREFREATTKSSGYSFGSAEATRRSELGVVMASDLTFSYSDFEIEILETQVRRGTKLARMPWVVECRERTYSFAQTRNVLFLGNFGHNPNLQAVRFFAREVMPLVRGRLPEAIFDVIGSGARTMVPELASDRVRVIGYVSNLSEPLDSARVFVGPLFAGAGLKGKVLDAISHGVPCVLSPVAAEGTGLVNEVHCLIANAREEWADCVVRLYTDEDLWNRISVNAMELARTKYSFAEGSLVFDSALASIGITGQKHWGLAYRHARPERYGL